MRAGGPGSQDFQPHTHLALPEVSTHQGGMLVAIIPLLVAVAGLVIYAMSDNPKTAECGRLMFACGLLAVCFIAAHQTFRIG